MACHGGPEPVPSGPIEGVKVEVEGGYYYDITAPQLKAMLDREEVLLINTGTSYEGEIEGTDRFIPYVLMPFEARALSDDLDVKIVLYCHSGEGSAVAAIAPVRFGYTNVWNLMSGMKAWVEAGYSVLRKEH